MTLIMEPQLVIEYDGKNRVAVVRATCRVQVTSPMDCLVKLCPDAEWFSLSCWLHAVDFGVVDPAQPLAWVGSLTLPPFGEDPDPPLVFQKTMSGAILNEDIIGQDEVAARFTLYERIGMNAIHTRDSNVVTGHFR